MTTWTKDELRRIAGADDLRISPFGEAGETYGTLTGIWVCRRQGRPLCTPVQREGL
jgi:hypothetical protein